MGFRIQFLDDMRNSAMISRLHPPVFRKNMHSLCKGVRRKGYKHNLPQKLFLPNAV